MSNITRSRGCLGLLAILLACGLNQSISADQADTAQTLITLDIVQYLHVEVVGDSEVTLDPVTPQQITTAIANNTPISRSIWVNLIIDTNIDTTLEVAKTLPLEHSVNGYEIDVSTTLFYALNPAAVYDNGNGHWKFDIVHPGFPSGMFLQVTFTQYWSYDIPAGDYSGTLTFEVVGSE